MNYSGKNVLVTGGAGAIGTNLVRKLAEENANVYVLDDLSSGFKQNVKEIGNYGNVSFTEGSVVEEAILEKLFSKDIDMVFHLAALFANQNSVDHPRKDLMVNGMGTLKMGQFAVKHSVDRFVYTSSSCVYGSKKTVLDEANYEYSLDTPYAITKLLGERYATFFHENHGLNSVILRLFNVFGPWEFPGKYRNVIPNFLKLASGGKPLTITGTGEETRDFNYCEDTVRAIMLAGEKKKAIGEIINLGSGKQTRIIDLANKINSITGNKAGVEFLQRRSWDTISKRVASIEKAKRILGYTPEVSFDQGLKKTYDWFMEVGLA